MEPHARIGHLRERHCPREHRQLMQQYCEALRRRKLVRDASDRLLLFDAGWVQQLTWSPMADSMDSMFLDGLVTARSKAAEARKSTAAVKALEKPL